MIGNIQTKTGRWPILNLVDEILGLGGDLI